MEVVFCQYQLKLEKKIYDVILVELDSGCSDEQEQMKRVWTQLQYLKQEEELVWFFNRKQFRFKVKEIYYIYSYRRKTEVYTHKGVFSIRAILSHEEIKLSEKGFIRVHQGYLVRKEVVRCIGPGEVILENNIRIPVSNKYKKTVKKIFGK